MRTPLDLPALALEMKAAQDAARQLVPFTTRLPEFDLSAAYEVAHLVHRARLTEGAKPVGRKIGFTNPDMWAKFGVREPIWAYMYDTTVVRLGGVHVTCSLGRLVEPKIEPEIVFGFRTAPRAGAGPLEVLSAIDWVAHGFEIVQSHFPDWKFQAADTIADGGLHGALVVGEPVPLAALGADPAADTPFLASKGVADARLLALDLPAVVLRPSLVLGPGAASSRWLQQLSPWPVIPLLDNHARLQPLHVDDLCAAVLALLRQWPAQSCVLPLVGPEAMTQGQLLDRLRAVQGWVPARYWVLPGWLARPAAVLGDRLGWQRLNSQTLTLARRDNLASPEPLAAVCGQRCLPLAQRLHAWPAPAVSAALALQPLLLALLVLLWLGTAVASLGPGWDWGLRILAEAGLDGWLAQALVVTGKNRRVIDEFADRKLDKPEARLQLQIGLMLVYMLLSSLLLPHYWADPLQSVGKNLILLPATLWLLWLTPPARSRR